MADEVLTEKRDGFRILTLNRPERLNAVNEALHIALRDAIADAESDAGLRALVITGAGRAFCAGQDLADRILKPGEAPRARNALENYYNPLIRRLRSLPFPVVAAVNGVAAGAGCNIALACDIVIAARSATFSQAFARIGLIPDCGGTFFLPRLVGRARALGLALLADALPAEKAEDWGLIWKCVDDAALMDDVEKLCAQFTQAPTFALGLIKRAIDASGGNDLDAQLDLERDLQLLASQSPDFAEGVRAFAEKRKPSFSGRKAP